MTNGAGYAQETRELLDGRLILGGGLRFDEFRYDVADRVNPDESGVQSAGRWQGKGNVAFTPSRARSADVARQLRAGDQQHRRTRAWWSVPISRGLATTDFYQVGTSSNFGRWAFSTDAFLIDHSNEQVYIPDDGSFEFKGPSRAYGYEAKASVAITRHLSLNGGLTKIANAFFLGGDHRVYVDSAPHFVANASADAGGVARLERVAADARDQSLPAGRGGSVDCGVGAHGVRPGGREAGAAGRGV